MKPSSKRKTVLSVWIFRAFFCLVGVILFPQMGLTQHDEDHHGEEEHGGVYEVIISGIRAFEPETKEGAFGTEVHFTYWFNHTWGTGLSYTLRYSHEILKNDLALLGSWNATKWLTLNVGPNFSLPNDEQDHIVPGLYLESEVNIRPTPWFHFGPVLGSVYSEHLELSAGVHIGFEF